MSDLWTLDQIQLPTVTYLVQEVTISSQEICLVAWTLLLSQRQDFLKIHLAGVPNTSNEDGTMEIRDKMLSIVQAQDLDTSGYQVSYLDNVELYSENDQLDVDAVFRPGIDAPFPPQLLSILRWLQRLKNPILIDEDQDKENSSPPPTTPVSERPTQLPVLMRHCPFGPRIENVPDYVYRNLFDYFILFLLCINFDKNNNYRVSFIIVFFKN